MQKVLPLNKVFSSSVIFLLIFFCRFMSAQENQKSRAIIIMDIEADPDGTQSLIQLLLYSNILRDIKLINEILK